MTLLAQKSRAKLVSQLVQARGFSKRLRGLIGSKGLKEEEGLWIPFCSSVHTFFMGFPIDIIFTDREMRIVSLFENIRPGKMIFGGWKSRHVFEIKAGRIQFLQLKKGEALHVES